MELIFIKKYHMVFYKNINKKSIKMWGIKVFSLYSYHFLHTFSKSPQLIIFLPSYNPKAPHLFTPYEAPKAKHLQPKSQPQSPTSLPTTQIHRNCFPPNPKKPPILHNARSRRHLIHRNESLRRHFHEFHHKIYERPARPKHQRSQPHKQIEETALSSFHKPSPLHLHPSQLVTWQIINQKRF